MNWEVLEYQYLLQSPWLTVRQDACRLPNGQQIDDFYVLEYPNWCNVLALTLKREVVLVRQYRHAYGGVTLELPGGIVDGAGDPEGAALEAAGRELLEETGYRGILEPLGVHAPNPATQTNRLYSFIARDVSRHGEQNLDTTEAIEVVLKPLDELIDLAARGEFVSTLHLGTLFLACRHLDKLGAVVAQPTGG